jgi:hypothetical protein
MVLSVMMSCLCPPHSEVAADKKKRRADLAKILVTFEAHPLLKVTGWDSGFNPPV